jgi:ATP-dependent Clp protease ATP-binding subunit ClpC
MFERYTENARRTLFFARFEASQLGSIAIETEHLLLGVGRAAAGPLGQLLADAHCAHDAVRQEVAARVAARPPLTKSVEIPFSIETKRTLQYAAEEADSLNHRDIATSHLLMGLLREEKCLAATILGEHGVHLEDVRRVAPEPSGETTSVPALAQVRQLMVQVGQLFGSVRDTDNRAILERMIADLKQLESNLSR